jgi:CBS domain-containing protein
MQVTHEPSVKDVMTSKLITVPETMAVSDLAALLVSEMITGAPVVNDRGELVGVVSQTDLSRSGLRRARAHSGPSDFYVHGWEQKIDGTEAEGLEIEEDDGPIVKDIMTPTVYKVEAGSPISAAADLMVKGRIHRLVATEQGRVVGIVTTLDVLRAIARPQASPRSRRRPT